MAQPSRPSYFPPRTTIIPPSLKEEERHWWLNPELILSEQSAEEMIRSHNLMQNLLQSGLLEEMGLDPKLSGVGTLKGHGNRVAIFSLLINEQLYKEGSNMVADTRALASGAMMHDIGKLDKEIHDVVMFPGKIARDDPVAWTIIKRHPTVGRNVVEAMPGFDNDEERMRVAEAIYQHHERQDGNGYHHTPRSQISKEAQIISTADTMDVMWSRNTYKRRSTDNEVWAELRRCTGTQFQENVANAGQNIRPSNGKVLNHAA